MRRQHIIVLILSLAAVVVISDIATAANGAIRNGMGARSIGRGGTNIAFADNGVVLYDNPAGMVNIEGCGLADFGADLLITNTSFSNALNTKTSAHTNPFPMGHVALFKKSANGRWTYGLGMYSPAGFSSKYVMNIGAPFNEPMTSKSVCLKSDILPGIAYKVNGRLSLGASLGVSWCHLELEGPYYLQGPNAMAGTPLRLDLQSTGAAMVWSLGMQYALTDKTMLGLTYKSATNFQMHGTSVGDIPGTGSSLYDLRLDAVFPQSIGLGLKRELCKHRTLSVDLVWYNWSKAFDSFNLYLTNPRTPGFPELYEEYPLRWRDSLTVRVGYEQQICKNLVLRLGYAHHTNPIPKGTLSPYIQTILEHSFTTGLGWDMGNDWEANLGYEFCFSSPQTVGTSDFLGGLFDNSVNRAQAHFMAFSLQKTF